MATHPILKRLLDAGVHFSDMSQDQAEKLVKEFVKAGQARRKDSADLVQQLIARGRLASEQVTTAVQAEMGRASCRERVLLGV